MSDFLTYKLLDAVARYGSIRRAAEKSAITPSALNRRILNLEEEYGTPLFEHTSAGMRPNVAGAGSVTGPMNLSPTPTWRWPSMPSTTCWRGFEPTPF